MRGTGSEGGARGTLWVVVLLRELRPPGPASSAVRVGGGARRGGPGPRRRRPELVVARGRGGLSRVPGAGSSPGLGGCGSRPWRSLLGVAATAASSSLPARGRHRGAGEPVPGEGPVRARGREGVPAPSAVRGGRGAAAASRRLVRCPRGRLVFPPRGPRRGQREGASARPAGGRGERGRRLPVPPARVPPWPRRAAPLVVAPGGSEWRRQPPRGPPRGRAAFSPPAAALGPLVAADSPRGLRRQRALSSAHTPAGSFAAWSCAKYIVPEPARERRAAAELAPSRNFPTIKPL